MKKYITLILLCIILATSVKAYNTTITGATSDSATICIYIPECPCIGPTATVLSPLPCGIISACERQEIRILARDNDTLVNPNTISFTINGTVYNYPSNIRTSRDTIIFTPTTDWHHGDTIRYQLIRADDYWGCPLESTVSCWFIVDTRPPEIASVFPPRDTTLTRTYFNVYVDLIDSPAGVDTTTFRFSVDGRVFTYPDSALRWSSGRLIFYPNRAGIRISPYDTIRFCLEYTRDRVSPLFCGPNELTTPFCWNVYIDAVGPIARIITPRPDSISACENQEIRILLSDPSGIDPSSVVLNINGTAYRINPPQLTLVGDTLIFRPTSGFWADNDTVVVGVYARDIFGNGLAPFELVDSLPVNLTRPGGSGPTGGLAWNGRHLLFVIGATGPDSIAAFDFVSRTRIYSRQTNINMIYDIAFYNGYIYASGSTGRVFKLDTLTFSAVDTSDSNYGMGHTIGLTAGGGYIWAAYDCSTIVKLDPINLSHRGSLRISPQPEILAGLAWMCDMLVGYVNNDMLVLIDPSTGFIIGSLPVLDFPGDTTGPEGLAFANGILWASDLYPSRRRIYGFMPFLPGCSNWNWFTDFSPPIITSYSPAPNTVITDSIVTVRICLWDRVSGVNNDSVRISIDGRPMRTSRTDSCFTATMSLPIYEDTLIACLDNAEDMPVYCQPNETSFCWVFMVDRVGPTAQIIAPLDNTISACRDQQILILIRDISGVDTNSIRLEINGVIYDISSPSLFWRNPDTLVFSPPSDTFWHNGQRVVVRLLSARDRNGNQFQGSPLEWRFTLDFASPVHWGEYPENGSVVTEFTPTIGIFIADSISGLNYEQLRVRIGTTWYNYGVRGIFFEERTGELRIEPSMLGLSFSDGETVRVCVDGMADSPDYCPPNAATMYCWFFRVSVAGPVARILQPLDGTFSACDPQNIYIYLRDPDGVVPSSISILVQGIEYTVDGRQLIFRNDTLIFVSERGMWRDGELVNVQLVSAEDIYGNGLSRTLSWSFTMDLSPPELISNRPLCRTWISDSIPNITFEIRDNISGVNDSSVVIVVNGTSYGVTSPCLTRIGNQWQFSSLTAGLVFHEGDTVTYCIYANDRPNYCGPNQLEFCCAFYVGLQGPIASIVVPQPGTYTACNNQQVIISISDTDGVVPSSIILEVAGRQFTTSSPELSFRNDTLIFTPSWYYNDGDTVRVRLIEATDTLGNPLQNPLDFYFIVDLTPPIIYGLNPSEWQVVSLPSPEIVINLIDRLSGIDTSSIVLIVDERDTFTLSDHLHWTRINTQPSEGRLSLSTAELGLIWHHNDTATICIEVSDSPDYCGPNHLSFCYRFRFDLAGPIATLINPPENVISSCVRQGFSIYIVDAPIPSGINPSSAIIIISSAFRSDTFTYEDRQISWMGDTLLFEPTFDYWRDGEEVEVILFDVRDIYGNSIAEPFRFRFTLDFTPPYIDTASPSNWEEIPELNPIIRFTLADRISGVSIDSTLVRIYINGSFIGTYDLSSPSLSYIEPSFVFSTETAGITLSGGDTVRFCVYAVDLAQLCEPNILDSCWYFTVPIGGPRASIVMPEAGSFSSCQDQRIMIRIRDIDGVDPTTIGLTVNGVLYTIDSTELEFRQDTLIFTPREPWSNGDIVVVNLVSADDILGNHLETPLNFSFTVDLMPPIFIAISPRPNDTVATRCPNVVFSFVDELSGLNESSVSFTVNGNRFTLTHPNVHWDGRTAVVNLCELGMIFRGGDRINFCVHGADLARYCGANTTDTCYIFYIESGGPLATLVQPFDGAFVSCNPETIIIEITDPNGVDDTTIMLEVNGRIYHAPVPDTLWYYNNRLYFVGRFRDNDTIRIELIRADDILGNSLSIPLAFSFIIDYSPPYIFSPSPGYESTIEDISPLISFGLFDNGSGVSRDSIQVRINGRLYTVDSSGLWWIGDTVYFDPDSFGLSFRGGDTVEVCIRAFDSPDWCRPNLFNTCYRFYIARGGPIANIVEPLPGTYSACDSQGIILSIIDTNGVNPTTIRLRINGITYTVDSASIRWNPPYLIFTPPPFFANGTNVNVELIEAYDNLGNPLERLVSWSFTMDLSPPVLTHITPSPNEIVEESQPDIIVRINDNLSGLNLSSIRISVNGTSYDIFSSAVIFRNDSLIFYPESLGISWRGGDRITVCLHATDTPDYCEPNPMDSCWAFYIATGGPRANIIRPLQNTISTCTDQDILIHISDPQGVNPSTITIRINGREYNILHPELNLYGDTLVFTPPYGYWSDNETVRVELLSAEDNLGNPLEAAPIVWSFVLDFSPPQVTNLVPPHTSTSLNWQQHISCNISDNILGVNPGSIRLTIEGVYRAVFPLSFSTSSSSLLWNNPTLIFYPESVMANSVGIVYDPSESLGPAIYFPEFSTIHVIVSASENAPHYCDPHQTEYEWYFTIQDDDTTGPIFGEVYPPYWPDDSGFTIYAEILDSSGIYEDSIYLYWSNDGSVDDGTYDIVLMDLDSSIISGELTGGRFKTRAPIPPQRYGARFTYRICAYDNDYDFMNSRDRKRSCFDSNVSILTGPVAIPIEPLPNTITACSNQTIAIAFSDSDGVDISSIVVEINGRTYDLSSPEVHFEDSVFYWRPNEHEYFSNNEDVYVRVIVAKDMLGNPMRRRLEYRFSVDLEPPELEMTYPLPNSIVREESPNIEFRLDDNLAGIKRESIVLRVQGQEFRVGEALHWSEYGRGGRLILDGARSGLRFNEGDTIDVELRASDNPNYCQPNQALASWRFVREPLVYCAVRPNPFTPNNDGYNDFTVFDYPYMFTEKATIIVYDRWNKEVFRKEVEPIHDFFTLTPRGWDGKDKSGKILPQGIYIYLVKVRGEIVCNGTVILAR